VTDISPTGHVGTIHHDKTGWWVVCSCDWPTPRFESEGDARDAFDSHLYFAGQHQTRTENAWHADGGS
jgi:hypothetical protein